MEKPFYEFDLIKENDLINELEDIYDYSKDVSNYTKLIFRGPERDGFVNQMKSFNSYEELCEEYIEIQNYLNNVDSNISQLSLFGNSFDWKLYPKIYKSIVKKILQIYESDIVIRKITDTSLKVKKFTVSEGLITMYKKDGILASHQDGKPAIKQKFIKPANILLYLNKDYKKEWGGNFVVDGIEVVPSFGKLVFLNFKGDSDPKHEVSVIKEDINRIALLFNVTYLESERIIWNIE
jgi:Rps23 Pro-64 3,4-dihydroxylase Tpa1-like proline 4-hydroxylase